MHIAEMGFENLVISRVIVHETNLASVDAKSVRMSEDITPLDNELAEALQKRLVDALGDESHSVEVEIEKDSEGSTFQLCASLLGASQKDFVTKSKTLAQNLSSAQTHGNIRSGLAVVINGTLGKDKRRFAAVIKAETDTGFLTDSDNQKVVHLHFIKNLFLTPQQRLYKIGVFIEDQKDGSSGLRSKTDFSAVVYDHLMTSTETKTAAAYFLVTFLGCSVSPSAKKLTRDFYQITTEFINNLSISDEDKVDAKNDLNAYLRNQRSTFQVKDFADDHFEAKIRPVYMNHMREKKFPTTAVSKDIAFIKNKLRHRRIRFTSGIRLVGPADEFNESVQIHGTKKGWTQLSVKGSIDQQG